MSSSNPPGGEFPFFNLGALFGQGSSGNLWKQAADMATAIASSNNTEPNLDPMERMRIEDLARVAELHVSNAPGVSLPTSTRVSAVTRGVWAARSVEAYRPFFDEFGQAISNAMTEQGTNPLAGMDLTELNDMPGGMNPAAMFPPELLGQIFSSLGPLLVTSSAGSMIGHLGQRALGQYDLPIPRPGDEVFVVPANIDEKSDEWDVDLADLQLWVLVHDLATHATLSVPHVRARLEALLIDFASAFRPNIDLIQAEFGEVGDPAALNELTEKMNDPEAILSMMRSPAQDLLVPQLDSLVAIVLGFVDHTVTSICEPLIPTHDRIRGHIRERWIDVAPADRFMERLLGLQIDEATLSRGDNFINGVTARVGDEGLVRLWADELDLPTSAEVDAPGLWLARIGLGEDGDGPANLDVPDDLSGLDDL